MRAKLTIPVQSNSHTLTSAQIAVYADDSPDDAAWYDEVPATMQRQLNVPRLDLRPTGALARAFA